VLCPLVRYRSKKNVPRPTATKKREDCCREYLGTVQCTRGFVSEPNAKTHRSSTPSLSSPSSTELQRRGTLASFVKKLTNRPFPFHDFCRHTHRALHFSAAITAKKSPTTVNYREKVLPRLVRTKYNLFARKARAGRPGVAKTNETSMFQWRTILSARKTSASATQRRTNPLTVTRRRRHPVSVRSG